MNTDNNKKDIDELVQSALSRKLYVYNDDIHSFWTVIFTFMRYLGHNPEQAEQCATLIHNVGKCCVKEDHYDRLYEVQKIFDKLEIKSEIK